METNDILTLCIYELKFMDNSVNEMYDLYLFSTLNFCGLKYLAFIKKKNTSHRFYFFLLKIKTSSFSFSLP